MREINIGTKRYTKVICLDEPGAGGACHDYRVTDATRPKGDEQDFAIINFQNGAIQESGVNGCHNEDLIAIVIDRLQGFQSGDFVCDENDQALHYLEHALMALNSRTQKRIERGVEGKLIV